MFIAKKKENVWLYWLFDLLLILWVLLYNFYTRIECHRNWFECGQSHFPFLGLLPVSLLILSFHSYVYDFSTLLRIDSGNIAFPFCPALIPLSVSEIPLCPQYWVSSSISWSLIVSLSFFFILSWKSTPSRWSYSCWKTRAWNPRRRSWCREPPRSWYRTVTSVGRWYEKRSGNNIENQHAILGFDVKVSTHVLHMSQKHNISMFAIDANNFRRVTNCQAQYIPAEFPHLCAFDWDQKHLVIFSAYEFFIWYSVYYS